MPTRSPKKRMPICPPEALEAFVACLTSYVKGRAGVSELRSAALGVWNCVDPLPHTCADLVTQLTGHDAPLRYSQAARQILRAL
jgi:hypothetical protein